MNMYKLSPRSCMSHLLLKDTFDQFAFIECEITTFNKFTIDGFLHKEFFDEEPDREYSLWKELREYCFAIIKGKRTPLHFKIVLSLAPGHFSDFLAAHQITSFHPEEIAGLYLNFHYDGTNLQCITGISMKSFRMDKTLEKEWDSYAEEFFRNAGIEREFA
ncbi:MAG: hypothetical protein K1W22_17910 [Lachnospiraceae bacterium]